MLTTTVELESSLQRNAFLGAGCLGVGSLGGIQGGNVGLVMLRMVKLHDLLRDVRLKSIISVW